MIEVHKPRALILQVPGINRDEATKRALELAGAEAEIIPITLLQSRDVQLADYQMLWVAGGYSHGDHIAAGRILGQELSQPVIADQIHQHLEQQKLILMVCNGFQAGINAGLFESDDFTPLPQHKITLAHNEPDQFQSQWIYVKQVKSRAFWLPAFEEPQRITVAHGEGRFLTLTPEVAQSYIDEQQVFCYYSDKNGNPATDYPDNPNGSVSAIAGITSPSGLTVGMMPHDEDYIHIHHDPNWRREKFQIGYCGKIIKTPDGLKYFFIPAVQYAAQL